ncbi:hypothetical protein MRX96_053716 [Rhipicephalus microplus]
MNLNRVRRSINKAPLQSSVLARSQRSLRVSATHRGRKTSPKKRTISRMQNCRTQRIPSEGEAERGGAVSTVAPGHRTPTSGRAARVAAAPTWGRGSGARLSR